MTGDHWAGRRAGREGQQPINLERALTAGRSRPAPPLTSSMFDACAPGDLHGIDPALTRLSAANATKATRNRPGELVPDPARPSPPREQETSDDHHRTHTKAQALGRRAHRQNRPPRARELGRGTARLEPRRRPAAGRRRLPRIGTGRDRRRRTRPRLRAPRHRPGNRPQRRPARTARGHRARQDPAHARDRDRPRGPDRAHRRRRPLSRARRGRCTARPRAARRFLARCRRRRLHPRRRSQLVRPQARTRRPPRPRDRARDRRRTTRPRRPRTRARPLLGAPRRRRQPRDRHRTRAPADPRPRGLRRHPLVADRARPGGPARLGRADPPRAAGRADHRRPVPPAPVPAGHPRTDPGEVVRRRRGDPPRRARSRPTSCSPHSAPSAP